ncbi:MAG: bifunctional diaminohydroxyphosphoribosylaminopyrimidine deaminase/5-amino-6-(5-phosphoribosylamino)uracil reductase RibD [Bacteroides sp.]|nr:bifunctional diaminohydroxyphosphoribosylaminopyrimidine deaminase/5-amino-6-(5-phosphoribosylamino)uracil reductase RibD [Bacteroides sp.]
MTTDEKYMRRALQLAKNGAGRTLSNPMVGAVIVADGRIIGEGWHRRYGGPHAEVNAVRSVSDADRPLLSRSTIYVTLEPCSHYGKTPPCAQLLIDEGIPRIVVGSGDPFPKVAGRGIRMLREAGREVIEGVLKEECEALNSRFMTAHRRGYPYIQLKWAQTADGYLSAPDAEDSRSAETLLISSPMSLLAMHRERAKAGGIFVGTNTVIADNPSLTCRFFPGDDPLPLTFDSPRLPADAAILQRPHELRMQGESLPDFLRRLYRERNILSLMVEGGAATLQEYLDAGLYDEIRIEINPELRAVQPGGSAVGAVKAPALPTPAPLLISVEDIRSNRILTYHPPQE